MLEKLCNGLTNYVLATVYIHVAYRAIQISSRFIGSCLLLTGCFKNENKPENSDPKKMNLEKIHLFSSIQSRVPQMQLNNLISSNFKNRNDSNN